MDGENSFRRVVNGESWCLGLTPRGWALTSSGSDDYGRVLAGPGYGHDSALEVADTEIERVTGVPAVSDGIGEWCYLITLNTGRSQHTRHGTLTPAPGATRYDLIKYVEKVTRENEVRR